MSGVVRAKDRGVREYALPVLFVHFSEEKEKEEKEEAPKDFFAHLSGALVSGSHLFVVGLA